MNPDQILIPAMLVFGLLVVGLVLTVIEFNRLNKKHGHEDKDKDSKGKDF
ncbi:hypothetical protein G6675_09325 [Polynucleobacter paneuropaeus]|jgi:hypothetical protein|nr:hypothetical protein [Polynucleobacter paneuropaeus]MBT8537886.1 hypothetical protein [Polynucleobacter paneuropaeus]MBT8555212.1 hypothetical protein [Polynucleobacter paneuropaeus]MBT8560488.1 hypothetical protein [Polynucleobacter paneuropaeus]MBT8569973.1 hypothetical protein [Polynucleobacter paneuropaeus]